MGGASSSRSSSGSSSSKASLVHYEADNHGYYVSRKQYIKNSDIGFRVALFAIACSSVFGFCLIMGWF